MSSDLGAVEDVPVARSTDWRSARPTDALATGSVGASVAPTAAHAWSALRDAAALPYRAVGRYAWHFARGKLGRDPLYRHLLATGAIRPGARVLDIGCGQGLVAALLQAVDRQPATAWPPSWAPAPVGTSVVGIERMPRDVAWARGALGPAGRVVHGDMRSTALPDADTVLLLDVLHYISPAEQDALLHRIRQALPPQGRLLLRVADASRRGPRALIMAVDRLVARARGLPIDGLHLRPLATWCEQLTALGFEVQTVPVHGRTLVANVLLVCDLRATVAAMETSA